MMTNMNVKFMVFCAADIDEFSLPTALEEKMYEIQGKFLRSHSEKRASQCTDFCETHNYSTALRDDSLFQISSKSVTKYGAWSRNSLTSLMSDANTVYFHGTCVGSISSCTEFHEHSTNCLFADNM